MHGILTLFQCSPTSDGAACVIVCSENFVNKHKLEDQAVQIVASALTTDVEGVFSNNIELVGYSMVKNAAKKVYQESGVDPQEI